MHVMLDLETMGVNPGCPVLAIGAVIFANSEGRTAPAYTFYGVAKADQDAWNLVAEESTKKWWAEQSSEARKVLVDPTAVELPELLRKFAVWLPDDARVWGNGAGFDQPILAAAYRATGLRMPWKFYNERCYRSLKNLAPEIEVDRIGTHHNALDDASSQAGHLLKIAATLGLKLG